MLNALICIAIGFVAGKLVSVARLKAIIAIVKGL